MIFRENEGRRKWSGTLSAFFHAANVERESNLVSDPIGPRGDLYSGLLAMRQKIRGKKASASISLISGNLEADIGPPTNWTERNILTVHFEVGRVQEVAEADHHLADVVRTELVLFF